MTYDPIQTSPCIVVSSLILVPCFHLGTLELHCGMLASLVDLVAPGVWDVSSVTRGIEPTSS